MSLHIDRESARRRLLESIGAAPAVADELFDYGAPPVEQAEVAGTLPLPDEPHVSAWRRYEAEAASIGAVAALARHFAQLRFPIRAGMSNEDAYRAATRQGRFEAADAFPSGVEFARPDRISIDVCPGMGGSIPVVTAGDRADFESLVRAFTERNEPVPVPPAMGACLVRGLNNWSRIADYRAAWEEDLQARGATDSWTEEFRRLAARKELYQDRLIILSRGAYSAVEAGTVGLDETDWLERSLVIRREHEFTHYFTYRAFGSIRSHIFDELIADFVGLVHAFGRYRPDLALRFLGLESSPISPDSRFWIYRGHPPISDEAMRAVGTIAVKAVASLAAIDASTRVSPADLTAMGRLTVALFSLGLEELASPDAPDRIGALMGDARR